MTAYVLKVVFRQTSLYYNTINAFLHGQCWSATVHANCVVVVYKLLACLCIMPMMRHISDGLKLVIVADFIVEGTT